MTIDAVPGSPTANSFCTVARATDLLQERLHVEAWYAADPEEAITLPHRREAALMQSTRLISEQVAWYGVPLTTTQALPFPQAGQTDALGRPVDVTTIPVNIERATAYYALTLLEAEEVIQAATVAAATGEGLIKSKKIGDTQITYHDISPTSTSTTATSTRARIPNEVWLLLKPYGMVPGFGSIPVYRT